MVRVNLYFWHHSCKNNFWYHPSVLLYSSSWLMPTPLAPLPRKLCKHPYNIKCPKKPNRSSGEVQTFEVQELCNGWIGGRVMLDQHLQNYF